MQGMREEQKEKCTVCKSRSRSAPYARHNGKAEAEVRCNEKKLNIFAAFILKIIHYDGN